MGNPAEGSGGAPFDTAPRDGRKNTDSHSVPNANEKTGGGAEIRDLDAEENKRSSGARIIRADKPSGGGDERSVTDPAGPEGRGGYNKTDSVNYIREGAPVPANEDIGEVEQ